MIPNFSNWESLSDKDKRDGKTIALRVGYKEKDLNRLLYRRKENGTMIVRDGGFHHPFKEGRDFTN